MTKTALISLIAALAFSGAAFADSDNIYMCQYGKQKFASHGERSKETRDPDPVTHIIVRTQVTDGDAYISVSHVLRSGRAIDRISQYPSAPGEGLQATRNAWTWHGTYDRDPSITMTGTLRRDVRDTTYTETRFRNGRVEWSNVTGCSKIADDAKGL